jgi:hypothetical protein
MAKHAFPSGVSTGKQHPHGDQGAISSFSENGPTAKFTDPKGPNFSHKKVGKGPSHGGGTVGEKGSFTPYKGS